MFELTKLDTPCRLNHRSIVATKEACTYILRELARGAGPTEYFWYNKGHMISHADMWAIRAVGDEVGSVNQWGEYAP